MKLLSLSLIVLLMGVVFSADAQTKKTSSGTMNGYLIDKMCGSMMEKKTAEKAMASAAKHTKACATEESCAASGYGIMIDGKWTPFDEAGNKKATEFLKKTKAEDHLFVAVSGAREGNVVKVSSIKEAKPKAN